MDRLQHLRIINYFNLNCPVYNDEVKNTDLVISKVIGQFLFEYSAKVRQGYTFIVNYDNDIYSLLAFALIKNCISVVKGNIDIRYMGTLKTEIEKEYFKGIKPIGFKKASKMKKAVLITGFNPICNVKHQEYLSKHFIDIFNPLEHYTPENIRINQNFYFDKDKFSDFYFTDTGFETQRQLYWKEYFSYPITEVKEEYHFNPDKFYEENIDESIPVVVFSLLGTEEDFDLYDFILKSSKEGNIHLYIVNGDEGKIDFVKTNLNPYIDPRNMLQDINLLTNEDYLNFVEKYSGKYYYYNNESFKKEEEAYEDSSS